jgi:hypothetical protein
MFPAVRLSRPRLLLRALLLVVAGGFVLWKAWGAQQAARSAAGTSDAVLLSRLALVEGLLGLLGLAAAGLALLALRRRARTHTLRLGDLRRGEGTEQDGPDRQ